MSIDVVDDLHAAEDMIGLLREKGVALLSYVPEGTMGKLGMVDALAQAIEYCRPSCGADGKSHATKGSLEWILNDDCDCPCHPSQ